VPRLLTLSRAARLVGVRRGSLQSKIRSGELATFEGMVSAEDLLRAYPQIKLQDDDGLERLERIKDAAFAQRVRERVLPNAEVLVARLTEMSRDLAHAQGRSDAYRATLDELCGRLRDMAGGAVPPEAAAGLLAWLQRNLEFAQRSEEPPALLVQDRFMRIMTAHVQIRPSGHEFFVEGGDTLLETALRAGLAMDYGCSIGSCGRCKARIVTGQVQKTRHSDYALTAAEKSAGVVLMCCNTAVSDLVIEAREAHGAADMPLQRIDARVKSVTPLGDEMRLLHLQTPRTNRLRFLAGQFASLSLPDGTVASCPVASCPCDDRNLQFHIRRRGGDAFAERVFEGLKGADTVRVEGPRGDFVLNEESHRPLIFIAGESGFAPIKSLIEHALALDAAETLHLYWIASGKGGHYLDNLCRSWSEALDNFRYVPLTAHGSLADEAVVQDALRRVLQDHPRLADCDVYVAGPGALVNAAEYLLLDCGLPRAQLTLNPPET
jgi:CDP-4-dehydro-6-deoxyglucose reductase